MRCCVQCCAPIICEDDEACICIGCGGRNRRATVEAASDVTEAILTVLAVLCAVLVVVLGAIA